MKKILGITLMTGIIIAGLNFDKVLIGSMKIVDAFGNMTGISVIEEIDQLNEVYYNLYEE